MGWLKKRVKADLIGNNITVFITDGDDCWRDVCALRSYKTSGPVATCEMAFARAALAMWLFRRTQSEPVANTMCAAASRAILDGFGGEDTDKTAEFYHHPLSRAAPETVALYLDNAFPITQLASLFGSRVGVPGMAAIEIAPLLEAVSARITALMKPFKIDV